MKTVQLLITRSQVGRILPVLCWLATAATASAAQSGDFTYTVNTPAADSVTITGYTGAGGAVVLPDTIASLPVTAVGDSAFYDVDSITSITIPDSVTEIGISSFFACSILTQANIGNGVGTIGQSAFLECPKLADVTIGSTVSIIGDSAFSRCYDLVHITIPNSVINIGNNAFKSCNSLVEIAIPDSVATIGSSAFFLCQDLASVTIGTGTTFIGSSAFSACLSLTAITVDAANPAYSSSGGVLFNKNQTTLTAFPGGKTGSYTIPAGVATIGTSAFSSCPNLTHVTVPGSVATIGRYAFYGCSSLAGVYFEGDAPVPGNDYIFQYSNNVTVYYLAGTTGWGATYGGRPTALWNSANSVTLADPGVTANQFGFFINGTNGQEIVVEALTSLTNSVWLPLQTNTLGENPLYFSDAQWTNHPARFYRVRVP